MYKYSWITLLCTRNQDNIVNQLYFNEIKKDLIFDLHLPDPRVSHTIGSDSGKDKDITYCSPRQKKPEHIQKN